MLNSRSEKERHITETMKKTFRMEWETEKKGPAHDASREEFKRIREAVLIKLIYDEVSAEIAEGMQHE